ncbi:MAG: type IV pilin protein [Planctomycetota bacterium]
MQKRQGFTIIELMIVVVVAALLAAIAIPAYSSYMHRARISEAVSRLASIKMREEAYFSEHGSYTSAAANPTEVPIEPERWEMFVDNWAWLGFNPDGHVRFQYTVVAGPPNTVPDCHGPMGWIRRSDAGREHGHRPRGPEHCGYDGSDHWYIAQARGDLDGDGNHVLVEMYSAARHVYISEAKGWE